MKIKLVGLTRRWMFNVLSTIIAFLILIQLLVAIFAYNYYYESIHQVINSQISTIQTFFEQYTKSTDNEFESIARAFAETYEDKDRFEVQIFNNKGQVIVSTSGFTPSKFDRAVDYENAVNDTKLEGKYVGELSNGEHVMANTIRLNGSIRAVRMIVSLTEADKQIIIINTISLGVIAGILIFICFSGWYFIRSIIRPVRKISSLTNQIALGNFDVRIETNDTDEIGELCNSINYMANELNASEHIKNEFISSVSHELRTPLTAIKGWAETVNGANDDHDLVKKGMSVIISEAERLSGIVEDLLDFSRMQSGNLSFKMESTDLSAEIGDVVLAFTDTANRAGIVLKFEDKELPIINADGNRLKQVFVNILDNAIKNTEQGGEISIDFKVKTDVIETLISDNGRGIAPEDLEYVKKKFYKANKTIRGSGIGLAVADEIIVGHGGSLLITSLERVGTTVTVILPIATKV